MHALHKSTLIKEALSLSSPFSSALISPFTSLSSTLMDLETRQKSEDPHPLKESKRMMTWLSQSLKDGNDQTHFWGIRCYMWWVSQVKLGNERCGYPKPVERFQVTTGWISPKQLIYAQTAHFTGICNHTTVVSLSNYHYLGHPHIPSYVRTTRRPTHQVRQFLLAWNLGGSCQDPSTTD